MVSERGLAWYKAVIVFHQSDRPVPGAGRIPPINKPRFKRRKPPIPAVTRQERVLSSAVPIIPQESDAYKKIADRVAKYDANWRLGLKSSVVRKGNLTVPRHLPDAITKDPDPSDLFQDPKHWFEIDERPPLKAKADGEAVPPNQNHYMNMYHDTAKAAVMLENFRHRDAEYYASDAFFNQWMRATKAGDLKGLPSEFPAVIYRNHIENPDTLDAIHTLGGGSVPNMDVEVGSEAWHKLKATPNVKATINMMNDFNTINIERGRSKFKCIGLRIYQGPTLKFTFAEDRSGAAPHSH